MFYHYVHLADKMYAPLLTCNNMRKCISEIVSKRSGFSGNNVEIETATPNR